MERAVQNALAGMELKEAIEESFKHFIDLDFLLMCGQAPHSGEYWSEEKRTGIQNEICGSVYDKLNQNK